MLEGPCSATEDRSDNRYQVGSIMSYCQKALTFHPFCQTLMRTVAEASRFTLMKTLPDHTIDRNGNAEPASAVAKLAGDVANEHLPGTAFDRQYVSNLPG
jgi:hypothetical protein